VVGKSSVSMPVAHLPPSLIEAEPFTLIMVDCEGPLPRLKKGYNYFLTILDVATSYPEAILLHCIKAKTIVEPLIKFFSWAGLPYVIQYDWVVTGI